MDFMDLVKDESDKYEKQADWIRDRFRAPDLQVPSQAKIAENIIHFLFERRLFEQAVAVYQHLLEDGLRPSPSTDALFLAVTLKASKAPGPDQFEGFQTILAYRSFTETHFMEFLDHIISLDITPDTAVLLTRLFISVKEKGYRPSRTLVMKLVDLQTRAGQIVEAMETIDEYGIGEYGLSEGTEFFPPAEPYAQMIVSTPVSDQAAVDWIMGVMKEKDVPIHIMVFNSLIARQKDAKDLRKASAFYGVLIRLAATTSLRPDAKTYSLLFRMYGYHYKPNYKRNASRKNERLPIIIPPRQLFSDMMSLWFSAKTHAPASDVLTLRKKQIATDQSLLTIAFRTFLYLDDYPAALVVLRMISELGLQINEHTYFMLLRHMARKVYYDVHSSRTKKTPPTFALKMIGQFDNGEIEQDVDVVYRRMMERLLEHNRGRSEGDETAEPGPPRGRIPTVDEILEHEHHLSGDRLDLYPLVNILNRAVQTNAPTPGWEIPGKPWRKTSVMKARYEMVPKDIPLWTWQNLWTWKSQKKPIKSPVPLIALVCYMYYHYVPILPTPIHTS
ncbi:hypothetical protein DFH09DRAFT_1310248 [Mycena vulgaris]|nr:hypothetical protein DFH09DRAFT_1310248 [Mycena vulgaris]